jgi:hypothetical protein
MTERKNQPSGATSRTDRRAAGRVHLDYATWWVQLAAPGSRFTPERPAQSRTVRLDAVSRAAASAESERRAA